MSSTCTRGRQGVPSLCTETSPVVYAAATRLLTTTSPRSLGEDPYAVALRKKVGLNLLSASFATSCSTRTLDSPYGVIGLNAAVSVSISSVPARPYRLQEEANKYRGTPTFLATLAIRTEAK